MLDFLFGWTKASKCKKLIKRTQCRLKLLISKRFAVIRLLKEDIAQLLKNGLEQIAFNKLDQLYVNENLMSIYEMLNTFSEFILLNLSYIRRNKDISDDVNEAISTLIFASARIGDLPELRLIRKLFSERYGRRFVTAAVELYPGNLVNCQVKDKFISQSVPDDVRNRMVDEIVRDYFSKPGYLAIEYKPDAQDEQLEKVIESTEVQIQDTEKKEIIKSANYSVVLQSSPSIPSTLTHPKVKNFVYLSPTYQYKTKTHSSESSTQYPEISIIYLDDVEEFKSPIKQRSHNYDQDQRIFMFKMDTPKPDKNVTNEKLSKKRMRRRSALSKEKPAVNDAQHKIYYNSSPGNRPKCQKKIHFNEMDNNEMRGQVLDCSCKLQCSLDQPCYFYPDNDQRSIVPFENGFKEFYGSTGSPRHVHPKLPDYDEIAAKFRALKKAHQQTKGQS